MSSPTSSLCKTILDLSFVPMRRIFDRLSLRDLLQLEKVCTRFSDIQKDALYARQSVTVWVISCSIKPDQMQVYDRSIPFEDELLDKDGKRIVRASLRMPQLSARYRNKDWIILTAANAKWLASVLPNVHTLECFISWPLIDTLEPLNDLLKAWSKTLVTLSVWTTFHNLEYRSYQKYYPFYKQRITENVELLNTINSMQSLKHLVVDLYGPGERIDMPIVSRLESFYFFGGSHKVLSPSLQHLSNSQTVRHAGFNVLVNIEQLLDLPFSSHQFASKVTILNINWFDDDLSRVRLDHFVNLTTLELDLSDGWSWPNIEPTNFSMAQLAKSLIVLRNLVHLSLHLSQPLQASTETIPQLNGIKVISVNLLMNLQASVESLQLHTTFPDIMVIKFYSNGSCDDHTEECRCSARLEEQLLRFSTAKRIEIRDDDNRIIFEKRN